MTNGISFTGNINLTTYEQGLKKVARYITTPENDKLIKETAAKYLGYYNFDNFKILKEEQDAPFRKMISSIIGQDVAKKNYLETSIASYTPGNIVIKDLNRRTHGGIELDIVVR